MKEMTNELSELFKRWEQAIWKTKPESVEEFLARGGKITKVHEDESAIDPKALRAKLKGGDLSSDSDSDYTDMRMREAENLGVLDNPSLKL